MTVSFVAFVLALVSAIFVKETILTTVQLLYVHMIVDTCSSIALSTE